MTTLLAATANGVARVVRSEDGDWSADLTLEGVDARCLAVSRSSVFAGVGGSGVFRSVDAGATWSHAGLDGQAVRSIAARGSAVYVGTREPRVHASHDGGETWSALAPFARWRSWWWLQPAESPFRPSYVSALAITSNAVIAGIEACGVFASLDGGDSWTGHRRRALRDCHELHVVGERTYEAGSGGLAESHDGGLTWRRRRRGLDRRYGWSVAAHESTLYLTVAPYRSAHRGNARARIVRAHADGPWEACTGELASLPRLACAPSGSVFAALGDGSLLVSHDEGDSWATLPLDLGGPSQALLAIDG